jgi:BirA family biotin operon repressor/biotin-[acetyl-CoA-carboxylase] ligase
VNLAPLSEWQGRAVSSWRDAWRVPRLEVHATIGSTNDRALELAIEPASAFAVVIADEQTAGRGRRGAGWHSPAGAGLWMSIVLPWSRPAPHVTLLLGLAVAEAIERVAAGLRVGLKWPNDLQIGRRKVGGVLCESAGAAVVAGIGINLRPLEGAPAELRERATALETETSSMLPASTLAGSVIASLQGRSAPAPTLEPAVLAELSGRDALAGAPVDTDEHGHGIGRGIDREGALLLERPDGSRVRVVAGSVRRL